ncbi:serine/threonine-protein kinase ULK3 [Elysia marginata]|uniref:non-specific serine/threonine protein kinase n=1 Tax=Elysia marginata TaxID=1093978 RepID=A0AAV4G3K4_9GAST|nr:serine/threonine-protein kinase ULK3 [Elysia marginata]
MAKPTTSSDKLVPKPSLGQYVFTEKLGSGTYATVYKAYRKTGIREVVAIKCVLKSSLNKASTENLLTEIELLKNLKHVHIVTLRDFQWDANYIYLIMEFCSGGDLSRFIRSKRALPETIVKRFLQQIDFGFAKHLYDGDNLHVMRGSPLYMAPEIICQGTYDNRVDLWSVGVILFECLFGKPPFASKSFKELGAKIWDDNPIEMPSGFDISDKARDLTFRLLQRQPSSRITFEEFFAHPFVDLEHIPSKNSLSTASTPPGQMERDKEIPDRSCNKKKRGDDEKSTPKKEALRAKVKQYMRRAESLKQIMKSNLHSSPPKFKHTEKTKSESGSPLAANESSPSDLRKSQHSKQLEGTKPESASQVNNFAKSEESQTKTLKSSDFVRGMSNEALETLSTMCEDSQELSAILKVINAAHIEEEKENYAQSLHHYEIALGAVLKLLPGWKVFRGSAKIRGSVSYGIGPSMVRLAPAVVMILCKNRGQTPLETAVRKSKVHGFNIATGSSFLLFCVSISASVAKINSMHPTYA